MPEHGVRKLVVVDGSGLDPDVGTEPTALFNPDGTPLIPVTQGQVKEIETWKSPDGSLWNITMTDNGTFNITEVV